jgi:regulator of protease activity HflC (stomatin/prohibitin superfamily)
MGNIKDFIEYLINMVKIWVIVQPFEKGLRIRNGKHVKKLSGGIHFKLPYFDSVYVQESRLRIADMPMQTTTTKDVKTVTLSGAIGYSISDIENLYNTITHPETSIRNMAMSEIASYILSVDAKDIDTSKLEAIVLRKLKKEDYGINFEYFRVTNFAIIRAFRLIQDQNWGGEALRMNEKK